MTINNLENDLQKITDNYSETIRSLFTEMSNEPATHGDLCEFGRQTFYTFQEMYKEIIDYLKSN